MIHSTSPCIPHRCRWHDVINVLRILCYILDYKVAEYIVSYISSTQVNNEFRQTKRNFMQCPIGQRICWIFYRKRKTITAWTCIYVQVPVSQPRLSLVSWVWAELFSITHIHDRIVRANTCVHVYLSLCDQQVLPPIVYYNLMLAWSAVCSRVYYFRWINGFHHVILNRVSIYLEQSPHIRRQTWQTTQQLVPDSFQEKTLFVNSLLYGFEYLTYTMYTENIVLFKITQKCICETKRFWTMN